MFTSHTTKLIERSLVQLDLATKSLGELDETGVEAIALEAVGLHDELQRLERKWRRQVIEGGRRREPSDFAAMKYWYRRWLDGAELLLAQSLPAPSRTLLEERCQHARDRIKTDE